MQSDTRDDVQEDLASFNQLWTRKMQRMDASVKSSFDVHEEMLRRIENMEEEVQAAGKKAKDAEERVLSALARHSEQSEDRLASFEKRIAEMLSQQRDETRRAIDGMPSSLRPHTLKIRPKAVIECDLHSDLGQESSVQAGKIQAREQFVEGRIVNTKTLSSPITHHSSLDQVRARSRPKPFRT